MRKPERSSYTPLDFRQWQEGGGLVITPKFQRRGVWSTAARSYLIDTLLLGLPVPPIYLRVTQAASRTSIVREVVDGQQRISAVLDFMMDKFSLSKNVSAPFIGKTYSSLKQEEQDAINQYSFICEILYGIDDKEILEIFARLNTYSAALNAQELRNGRYFGQFKQSAYNLSLEHLEFWRRNKIFTEQGIARMQEVELTSELIMIILDGLQDKKKTIDNFYARYDDKFSNRTTIENRFRMVIDCVNSSIGDELAETEFHRAPLFYSLFGAIYHRLHGVPGIALSSPKKGRLSTSELEGIRSAVSLLSEVVTNEKETVGSTPKKYEEFVVACLRQTDNLRPRQIRLETIYRGAFL